jgi:hypothetical protein
MAPLKWLPGVGFRSPPAELTRNDVHHALAKLAARVPTFRPWDYDELTLHLAVEEYLGLEIGYQWIPDRESAFIEMLTRRSNTHGQLVYDDARRSLIMRFPTNLNQPDRKDAHYEELAHLIAGHPVPYRPANKPDKWAFWRPPKAICRRTPPYSLRRCRTDEAMRRKMVAWCEQDAARWVEHLRAISALGREGYLSDANIIGL